MQETMFSRALLSLSSGKGRDSPEVEGEDDVEEPPEDIPVFDACDPKLIEGII